jgi:hypothetical protein
VVGPSESFQLTGTIVSYFLEFGTPSRPSVKRLIHQAHEIWSGNDPSNANKGGRSLAFALVLPEYVDHDDTGGDTYRPLPLPPSASITMWDACAHVIYLLRVDMFRKGWRFHDT